MAETVARVYIYTHGNLINEKETSIKKCFINDREKR